MRLNENQAIRMFVMFTVDELCSFTREELAWFMGVRS